MFSKDEIDYIRLLANKEAQDVLITTLKGMTMVSGAGSTTSTGDTSVIISKSFDNPNAETMEQEINDWLEAYHATEIHHMDSVKNPNANFGVIKTIFIKIPRAISIREIQKPE